MTDESIVTEGQESAPQQDEGTGNGGFHPAELRKAQKALKEQAKMVADLQAKLKERETADLSEVEKLRAQLGELNPKAALAEELQAFAESKRDAALSALPKEAREKLESVIDGLPPHKALAMIEAVGLVQAPEARQANVARGAPPKPSKLPTLQQIEQNPELLDQLTREQLDELTRTTGIRGTGKVWGKR